MTGLHDLTDAFTELERRADAASAAGVPELALRVRPGRSTRPRSWLVPVAATAAVVAGLAATAALLTRGGDAGTSAGTPPASSSATERSMSGSPRTPEELTDRFRAVLRDTASFIRTESGSAMAITLPPLSPGGTGRQTAPPKAIPIGPAIVGTLTASGVTGGFDLQIYPTKPGTQASCDGQDESQCTVRHLPDGSSMIIGQSSLEGSPNGITYTVDLIRPDGTEILMHVSNERSPKGDSEVLGNNPPLSTDQMIEIVMSDLW